jgi:hypothetical protein
MPAAEPAMPAEPANETALREPARAAKDWKADPAAAVAARKAAAPAEIRTVLAGGLEPGAGETVRVFRVVAEWLVGAHAAAHADPATKRLARLVLGVRFFTTNMQADAPTWRAYKEGLRGKLQALGAPLAAAYARDGQRAALGDYAMAEHRLVVAERRRCETAGGAFELRSDIAGIVDHPAAWKFGDASARQDHEHTYIHMLKMLAMALNEQFHQRMRRMLAPHTVDGKGLMAKAKDGMGHYLCAEKGAARMGCKLATDHRYSSGCRSALNIDVLRVLGVCRTPAHVVAAMDALGAELNGCARTKVRLALCLAAFSLPCVLTLLLPPFLSSFSLPFFSPHSCPSFLLSAPSSFLSSPSPSFSPRSSNPPSRCGQNGFKVSVEKAALGFNLRVMMGNFVMDFGLTYAQLAEQDGVTAMWTKYVEESAPQGSIPRGRWRAQAAAALKVLTSKEFARKPVRFIVEAQLMLEQTHDIRSFMHEVRCEWRGCFCHLRAAAQPTSSAPIMSDLFFPSPSASSRCSGTPPLFCSRNHLPPLPPFFLPLSLFPELPESRASPLLSVPQTPLPPR